MLKIILPIPSSALATNKSKWRKWQEDEIVEFKNIYPEKGKNFCAQYFNRKEGDIRDKASKLKLKINKNSEFYKDWQQRAAIGKIGKKQKRTEKSEKSKLITKLKKIIRARILYITQQDQLYKSMLSEIQKNTGQIRKKMLQSGQLIHPKGLLGKRHTIETRLKASETGLLRYKSLSEEQIQERIMKMLKTKIKNGTLGSTTEKTVNCSWKQSWREIGGKRKYFRSAWEYNYACYLEFLKEKNLIADWFHEPETFWFENIKRGARSYLPDFKVINNNDTIEYHEVKGWYDARSKTKTARMKKYYPHIKLILIMEKQYKEIYKKLSPLIKGWEFTERDKR